MRKANQYVIIGCSLVALCSCVKSSDKSAAENGQSLATASNLSRERVGSDYQRAALTNVELGLGYLSQGQVARAKTKLTHAIKLAPKSAETHSAMAYFLEMVSDFKEAEREHKKAVSLRLSNGAVYNNYGAFLCRRNRYKEADQAFHQALEDKDYARTAEVYENAGLCAIKSTDLDAAASYLATAIQRDPNRGTAILELVALDLKQEKFNHAKALLAQYKNVAQPSARSLWLGIQLAKASNDENAMASQALLLKNLFEDSPEYQLYLESEKNNS